MKNFKHFIAIMAAVLTFGAAQAESLNTHRSDRDKDPWQIMQTTLYNHFVDTTGFSIVTSIDAGLLNKIIPDLAKAYQVKEKVDLSYAVTLGDVICDFMRVKYAGCSGQTYDYYKYRYSRTLIHDQYLEKYPNSPYANEMRLKGECLKQYIAWSNCLDAEDYFTVMLQYESSYCPYGGFNNLASSNNESRELAVYYIQSTLSQRSYLYDNDYNYDDSYHTGDGLDDGTYIPNDDFFEKDHLNDGNAIATLVTPNNKIGHSALCIGNMGNKASLVVSFSGPSFVNVVLDHGQYQWVDLENGEYEVTVTSNNGNIWSSYGNNNISVEDGVYMTYWCDSNGKILSSTDPEVFDNLDDKAGEEMFFSILKRAIGTLSDISELDHETSRKLLMHYIQQMSDSDGYSQAEMELLYNELTDDNIDLFINLIKGFLEELEKEYDTSYFMGKTFKL